MISNDILSPRIPGGGRTIYQAVEEGTGGRGGGGAIFLPPPPPLLLLQLFSKGPIDCWH